MYVEFLIASLAFVVTGPVPASTDAANELRDATLHRCLVSVKDESRVAAQEPGVLVSIVATEGLQVRRDELLAQIDDTEPRMKMEVDQIEYEAAKEEAEDQIRQRHAQATSKVSEAEYSQALDANAKVRGTFPLAEVRRLRLKWDSAELAVEQSRLEQRLAAHTARIKTAELKGTKSEIVRRRIVAPLDGEVVAIKKHVGEWVTPGEEVFRVVSFETLRVEGFLKNKDYDPRDVAGRPVTLKFELARGRREELPGRIVYVSPLVDAGGVYRIWAEVANRRESGHWLLRPGMTASMTIHVN